jgi:hypothetical protein
MPLLMLTHRYCACCSSLFEKDKLLFAFLLCCRIQASKGQVEQPELLFLLTGGLGRVCCLCMEQWKHA